MRRTLLINLKGFTIVLGVVVLSYGSYTYSTQEKVAQIGDLKVTAAADKTITFPPLLSGLAIVAGVVLVVLGRLSKK